MPVKLEASAVSAHDKTSSGAHAEPIASNLSHLTANLAFGPVTDGGALVRFLEPVLS
jgi:hypothetical protein